MQCCLNLKPKWLEKFPLKIISFLPSGRFFIKLHFFCRGSPHSMRIESKLWTCKNDPSVENEALQEDYKDTPLPRWVAPCQNLYSGLGLAQIISMPSKGVGRAQPIYSGHWNRHNEPVFVATLLFRLTELGLFLKTLTLRGFFMCLSHWTRKICCQRTKTKLYKIDSESGSSTFFIPEYMCAGTLSSVWLALQICWKLLISY